MIYQPTPDKCCTKCHQWFLASYCNFCIDRRRRIFHAQCRQCDRKRMRQWEKDNSERKNERARKRYADNIEVQHEKDRHYRETHREQMREKANRYARGHKEKLRVYKNIWRIKNAEKYHAQMRHYYIINQDRIREKNKVYSQTHREQYRLQKQLRRTRARGLPSTFTINEWRRCLTYWNHTCAICGRPRGFWHTLAADHWIAISDPRSNNPGTVAANIVPLCHGVNGCNNEKNDTDPLTWLISKYGPKKGKAKHQEILTYFAWVEEQDK